MLRTIVALVAGVVVGYVVGLLLGFRLAVHDYVMNDAEKIEETAESMFDDDLLRQAVLQEAVEASNDKDDDSKSQMFQ